MRHFYFTLLVILRKPQLITLKKINYGAQQATVKVTTFTSFKMIGSSFINLYQNGTYLYNKAACLSVCMSATLPCPQFWADFKTIYIFGLPMVQGRYKKYFQVNRSRNKKIFLMYTTFFMEVKNVRPSDRCLSVRQMPP